VACLTGIAATVAATSPGHSSPTPPAAGVPSAPVKGVRDKGQAGQVAWLAGFGTYDARTGTWNFVPNPRGC
jgi:hypothetical protein